MHLANPALALHANEIARVMTIALLCPNGHKLLCPESQAGKRGKCPHCGAIFRVPDTAGSGKLDSNGAAAEAQASGPIVVGAAKSGPMPVVKSPGGSSPKVEEAPPANPIRHCDDEAEIAEDEIAFLCPNGHHLCGSVELGGQPGECPDCGAKFLVPGPDDADESEEEPAQGAGSFAFDFEGNGEAGSNEAEHSRGEFFERLWGYKARGATIELYLEGGSMLIPDGYAADLSKRAEGVFLVKESDGTFTVAVVAWDSITHMAVRGLEEVPEGVFDVP